MRRIVEHLAYKEIVTWRDDEPVGAALKEVRKRARVG